MKRSIALLILFIPLLSLSQNKYKHEYRIHLKPQLSSYSIVFPDTIEVGKRTVKFIIADNKNELIPFVHIQVTENKNDSTIQSNIDGIAYYKPKNDSISIKIFHPYYTPIEIKNLVVPMNSVLFLSTALGKSNALSIAIIYSKRKLTEAEIEQINNDLSFNKGDNELIKNKTCYISWEI
ncbi:MAG: hypothetical protein JNL24_14325 [Bacteroidia bacterium]|nr:hypothetical protein [Bacteroidia bacterium]